MSENKTEIVRLKTFEVAKEQIEKELEKFNLVITNENTTLATKERAEINKLRKKYDDERKLINRLIKGEYDKLLALIDEKISEYDKQLNALEQERKDQVKAAIVAYYETLDEVLDLDEVFDEKWLNKTINWQQELTLALIRKHNELKRTTEVTEVETVEIITYKLKGITLEQRAKIEVFLRKQGIQFTVE